MEQINENQNVSYIHFHTNWNQQTHFIYLTKEIDGNLHKKTF
jgi:hypothetical protein